MSRDCMTRFRSLSMAAALATVASMAAARAADVMDALDAGWGGEKRCENLYEDDNIRVLRCTFPPNVGHERHSHPASFLYVLNGGRGTVTDSTGTREFQVKSDQSRPANAVEWHEMLNTGESTLRYLIVEKKYAPAK